MSGLLRRIKRSRDADAGDSPAEMQAAAPESATTTAEPAATPPPPIVVDPDRPAGLEPETEDAPAPTGRRARLRRRLRYLRRARELMLRDLGGLVYEVHRTGGGDMTAHGDVIDSKLRRLAAVEAETGAIETALSVARDDTIVFQPGVGGTCDFCGELYGSVARYCSNCGSPTGSAVRATPATVSPASRLVPPMPKPPAKGEPAAEPPTAEIKPEQSAAPVQEQPAPAAPVEEQPAPAAPVEAAPAPEAPVEEPPAPEAPTAEQPAAADEPPPAAAAEAPAGEQVPASPFSGTTNGGGEQRKPPELSDGDPLAREESRS
jgi:hypothetical protein